MAKMSDVKEPTAPVNSTKLLDYKYELERLIDTCEQLISAAGGDAGNVPAIRAPWVILCNAIEYYRGKGL